MRRILFPLLVIGLAGGLFTLGSGAFFSDIETDTSNTITAGTLDLQKTATFAASCSASTNAKPGDSFPCTTTLTNGGSLSGDLYMQAAVTDTNNLADVLTIAGGNTTGTTGALEGAVAATWVGQANWGGLDLTCQKVAVLDATETLALSIPTTFATSAGNTYQGGTATLNMKYKLIQAGAANLTCE
jgi:predicted ribosomally synthesized peptide with SipW-like signal peptide